MKNIDENNEYLLRKIEKMHVEDRTMVKFAKNAYVARANDPEKSVYILVHGVIILSFIKNDGERINIKYMNSLDVVSLIKDENEKIVEQPYDIMVDSEKAIFYKINRVKFWEMVNNDSLLSRYIRTYYRKTINNSINQMKHYIGNSKSEQVYMFLYECMNMFGVKDISTGTILINHRITHQTIGEFCGIRNRSSVTRIMNKLVKENIIERKLGLTLVKDESYFEKYAK